MTIEMAKLLADLGLESFEDPFGEKPAFKARMGTVEITIVPRMNRHLQRVYAVESVINTGRTLTELHSELPKEVSCREEGLALIGHFVGPHVPTSDKPNWLKAAELLDGYLPWSPGEGGRLGPNASGPLARERHSRVHISVDLAVEDDGSVEISGQDLGEAAAEAFGSDSYETWIRIKPEALHSLMGALLRARYEGTASAVWDFRAFCEVRQIPHEYGSWP
jgi:hypothetical protein